MLDIKTVSSKDCCYNGVSLISQVQVLETAYQ